MAKGGEAVADKRRVLAQSGGNRERKMLGAGGRHEEEY
jgi:hypothetical protein